MKQNVLIFSLAFIVAFAGGYFIYEAIEPSPAATESPSASGAGENLDEPANTTPANQEENIFSKLNCLSCHAVSGLELKGGATGPDLSQAFINVEGKHGISLEEFLKNPTSAVMSSVIGANPLSDEERAMVIEMLKQASEK